MVEYILDYYERTNLQDRNTTRFVEFIIFKILAESNRGSHIYYFLEPFAERIIKETSFGRQLTKLEDHLLEFKSQDYFSGGDADIVERLSQDLITKLNSSPCKVYLIGVEDDGTFNPIPSSRLRNDRIERIRQRIQKEVNATVYLIPILHGDRGVLILVAGGSNGD